MKSESGCGNLNKLLDKLVLFTLCLAVYLMHVSGSYTVVPVIIAVFAISAQTCFCNVTVKLCCFLAYAAGCVFMPSLLLFLPVLCYDMPLDMWYWLFAAALPVCAAFFYKQFYSGLFTLLLIAAGRFMSYRTETLEKAKLEYIELRDSAKELTMNLEDKYSELLQKQDYEINLATLSERNRIARDIHDSVGHLLSSAMLQIGALMVTSGNAAEKQKLGTVNDTLAQGMDSIRSSVHDLYDESIDLYTEVRGVVNSFTFCPVTLEFDVDENPDKKIKYAFITIIKEALANIARHSGATAAAITLRGQPAFYSLCISDNGHGVEKTGSADGLGLRNIADRVEDIGGILNINDKKGFKIYISVPKRK